MSKIIDFYFDFISPYSYIVYKKIKSMQNKNGVDFNYKPILLGGLHKLGNITAPAFNERKMKNMKNDCEIIANKNNISFKWNEKFPVAAPLLPFHSLLQKAALFLILKWHRLSSHQ